jgi:hypothetical protein
MWHTWGRGEVFTGFWLVGPKGSHVRWVPCHHGMARPQVADGGKSSGYGG